MSDKAIYKAKKAKMSWISWGLAVSMFSAAMYIHHPPGTLIILGVAFVITAIAHSVMAENAA